MQTRLDFHAELVAITDANVYFQPPANVKLKYPCVIYNVQRYVGEEADNIKFITGTEYKLMAIHTDPDDPLPTLVLEKLPRCRSDRIYPLNGLYHSVFTVIRN